MNTLWQDLRYGARMLLKNPGFTAMAAISLALGIGANTAVFSLLDAVALKTLPVRKPEELVLFNWLSGPNRPGATAGRRPSHARQRGGGELSRHA